MKSFILTKIRGALDLCLFIRGGEKAFRDTTFKAMLLSFLIPLIFLPYGIWGLSMTHNTELQDLSKLEGLKNFGFGEFIAISFAKAIIVTAFMLFVMYMFAKFMDRTQYYYDFLAAGNWMTIIGFFINLPMTLMVLSGGYEWMVIYMVATVTILYGLAISSYTITRVLNVPWELGAACAIFALAVREISNKIVHQIGLNYFG